MAEPLQIDSGNDEKKVSQAQLEAFKSFYFLIKSKRDTDIKTYNEKKVFRKADIIDLNSRINNKLALHLLNSSITTASINLSNKECMDFGVWASFENHNWNHVPSRTTSITLEWDFNVIFPNQLYPEVPQTHTIKVRIGSHLRPNEFFHIVMTGGEDHEIDEAVAEMVCKVDFVNTSLCEDIKNIVSNWYEGLPKSKPTSYWVAKIKRHRGKLELSVVLLCLLSCFAVINIGVRSTVTEVYLKDSPSQIKWIIFYISIMIPAFYLAINLGRFLAETLIAGTINRFKENPQIILTKGDENKIEEAKNANSSLLKELRIKFLITILVNILIVILFTAVPHGVAWVFRYFVSH